MKIRLTRDISIDPKHGLRHGRVLETLPKSEAPGAGTWVLSDTGQPVKILFREWEAYKEPS